MVRLDGEATVDSRKRYWMIKLGKTVREAERVIVTHFKPTTVNIGFVKSICLDNHLVIRSSEDDLVLERPTA